MKNNQEPITPIDTNLAAAPVSGADSIMAIINKAAISPDFDVAKLQELLSVKERWEANEAKKAYHQAMAAFNNEPLIIEKSRKAHNSMYAGLAETLEIVRPAMQEHGLSHSWHTEQHETGSITVKCCITHTLGHSECTSMSAAPDSSGSKNSIQALGSAQTYLQRYTLYAILGLASSDMDSDGEKEVVYITDTQAADLMSMIDEVGGDSRKLCQGLKINSLQQMPETMYGKALRLIESKRAAS